MSFTVDVAGPSTSSAPAHFSRLNSVVYLSHPSDDRVDPASPSLIILFGWFQAHIAHVKKYGDSFRSLYPTSTIMVVQMEASWLTSSQTKREALLEPVADIMEDLEQKEGRRFRGVFLHVMSNGGGMQLLVLSKVLERRVRLSSSRYPVALVMDSAPESNSMRCMVAAFTSSLRSPVAKVAATPIVAFLYSIFHFSYGTGVLSELRQRLLSPNLIPFRRSPPADGEGQSMLDAGVPCDESLMREVRWIPRLYMCSRADRITSIRPILRHVEQSRRAGFDVRTEIFDKTQHVMHAKDEPERYWGAVQQLWRDACARTNYGLQMSTSTGGALARL